MTRVTGILSVIKFSWNYSRKVSGKTIWLITFYRIYISLHPLINAYFIKLIIDQLTQAQNQDYSTTLTSITIILIVYFLVDSWNQFAFRHNLALERILQRRLISQMEVDLAYQHASLPVTTIEDSDFKDSYALVKRESGYRIFPIVRDAVTLISTLFSLSAGLVILWRYEFVYFLIILIVQIPRIIILKPAIIKILDASSVAAKYSRMWDIYLNFLESVKGSLEARILNIKGYVKHKLNILQKDTVGYYAKTQLELLRGRVATAILPMTGVFAIGYFALVRVLQQTLSIGDWQFIFSTSNRIVQEFKDLIDSAGTTAESIIFVQKLNSILEMDGENIRTAEKQSLVSEIRTIEFVNVSFRYPNANRYALKNISFTIDSNENIAIVGVNGAGKTTLVKLLCKFYQPSDGTILINGKDLQKLDTTSYRQNISALFQEFETYGISARESIGYGNVDDIFNSERITKMAKLVGIHKHIENLPKSYNTPLIRELDDGVGLSTGQWQKIAIARALFRKSKLIVLDEPTSNMDPESEEEIFNKLIRTVRKRIMILISHRFSTVKRADRIVVIDSGKLAETGSHKELMNLNGVYARLFRIQSESYKE
jgi:ABC-type bacteriocin/lantibiotic exporter with double-glycine peptidase domain